MVAQSGLMICLLLLWRASWVVVLGFMTIPRLLCAMRADKGNNKNCNKSGSTKQSKGVKANAQRNSLTSKTTKPAQHVVADVELNPSSPIGSIPIRAVRRLGLRPPGRRSLDAESKGEPGYRLVGSLAVPLRTNTIDN